MAQLRVVDNIRNACQSKRTLADFLVSVLMTADRILAVVQVNGFQPVQADDFIKRLQNAIQIPDDVIAAIIYMAGIQTNAHALLLLYSVQNGAQLLKASANLTALTRHGLQKHRRFAFRRKNFIQRIRNEGNPDFRPLLHMAAGVEIKHHIGQKL